MAKSLFLPDVDPNAFFEKEASISKMPDDEKDWPSHILSMLYEQLPFLSKFSVNIMIQRMEPEAGFAFGYALVLSKSDPRVSTESKNVENGIRIPLIVADRQLQPFHTFELKGQVRPLTPERVEAAMMNPAMFDGPAKKPGTQKSLVDQLYPPYQQRQGFGMTNTGTNMGGISKVSSAPQDMSPAQLRRYATLKATEKSDAASRSMTAGEKSEQAVRSGIIPTIAGAAIGAGKGALRHKGGGGWRGRLGAATASAGGGALTGAGISAVNTGYQEAARKTRDAQRNNKLASRPKKGLPPALARNAAKVKAVQNSGAGAEVPTGLRKKASVKEALARLDFNPSRRIPSSMVMKGSKVKVMPGVTPMSIHFFPIMGTKFVVGVDTKLAKKLGKMKDQNEIRRSLMGPMKSEIRAARGKRPSPGMFMLFVKTKNGYAYQTPTPIPGMAA